MANTHSPAKPTHITFTGADEHTSVSGMIRLAQQYPIEWGILFSPKRQGEGRYPPLKFIKALIAEYDLNFAAHLCGGDSRDVIANGASKHDSIITDCFDRVQINTADPSVNPQEIGAWARSLGVEAILQCRRSFPDDPAVAWLFDASGGRGISPSAWPRPAAGVHCGYAGGLRPSNVAEAVSIIGSMATNYWIDMEAGVRDANDRFDLALCREVCEAVYGDGAALSKATGEGA